MPVRLRPFTKDDVPRLVHLLNAGPEISVRTATIPFPYAEEDALRFLEHLKNSGDSAFAMECDGELVGAIGIIGNGAEVEIGYWVGKDYWGKGYATDAVALLIDIARSSGSVCLFADVFPDNPASARVLEKNGFLLAGEFEKNLPLRGGMRRLLRFRLDLTSPS
jgi:RimJ/RimL family protein N-acetyltransferase